MLLNAPIIHFCHRRLAQCGKNFRCKWTYWKFVPLRHARAKGERCYSFYSFLTSALHVVSGLGWVVLRTSLDTGAREKILCLFWGLIPSLPICIQTELQKLPIWNIPDYKLTYTAFGKYLYWLTLLSKLLATYMHQTCIKHPKYLFTQNIDGKDWKVITFDVWRCCGSKDVDLLVSSVVWTCK
jgi:hypothetical protein